MERIVNAVTIGWAVCVAGIVAVTLAAVRLWM